MRYLKTFGVIFVAVLAVAFVLLPRLPFYSHPSLIISFSASQARYLGIDPTELWGAILRDLKPQQVRLQANWNEVEATPGVYQFAELDQLVASARAAGATVTLAVGRKLPRWPECHDPAWLAGLPPAEVSARFTDYLTTTIEHYRGEPAIVRWQVENEPMFAYGTCAPPNWHSLKQELALVKQLDATRPILVTDSGELSSWWETAPLADEQGTTMYRVTWNSVFGYFTYPWPPLYYRLKAALVSPFVRRTVVSELQLEPWAPQGVKVLPLAQAQRSLSLSQFNDNLSFFRRTGFPEAMLWGVEWWYFAKVKLGEPGYWDQARAVLVANQP